MSISSVSLVHKKGTNRLICAFWRTCIGCQLMNLKTWYAVTNTHEVVMPQSNAPRIQKNISMNPPRSWIACTVHDTRQIPANTSSCGMRSRFHAKWKQIPTPNPRIIKKISRKAGYLITQRRKVNHHPLFARKCPILLLSVFRRFKVLQFSAN